MRKRIKVFFMMFLIIFSFFIASCKNENDSIVDNGLNVRSTDGDLFPPQILVHYKTEKRFLSIDEDLKISISFGRTEDYYNVEDLKNVPAELIFKKIKWNNQLTDYEEIDSETLKIINDFSLDEYIGTFTSDENIYNMIIPSEWFNNSCDSFRFVLRLKKNFSTDEKHIISLGIGASLYYRIIGEQIKLYGSFYEFKNDNV